MVVIAGPGSDFRRRAFVFCIGLNPFQDFSVAFASGEFFFHRFSIDAGELDEMLVHRAVEVIFAIFTVDGGAPFVEATSEDDIAAETHTCAARRLFGQIK